MTFMLDTACLADIKKYSDIFPIVGVTTNPSILKKEGKLDIFEHFKSIREIIGSEKSLHVQVVSSDVDTMMAEAHAILSEVDRQVYIKVPVTEAGLVVIQRLKAEGIGVTATAIYSEMQAYLAIAAGADFVAPYFNRMENLAIDAASVVAAIANFIQKTGSSCQILGASYKNISQINHSLLAGVHAVTVTPQLLLAALSTPPIEKAVVDFKRDWEGVYGEGRGLL